VVDGLLKLKMVRDKVFLLFGRVAQSVSGQTLEVQSSWDVLHTAGRRTSRNLTFSGSLEDAFNVVLELVDVLIY
jgi:hypothetical protein